MRLICLGDAATFLRTFDDAAAFVSQQSPVHFVLLLLLETENVSLKLLVVSQVHIIETLPDCTLTLVILSLLSGVLGVRAALVVQLFEDLVDFAHRWALPTFCVKLRTHLLGSHLEHHCYCLLLFLSSSRILLSRSFKVVEESPLARLGGRARSIVRTDVHEALRESI